MIDYKPTLKGELDTLGLPVYYELFVDSDTEMPCITYAELNDTVLAEANNNVRYSYKTFRIKLWGDDLAVLSPYLIQVDSLMFSLGFTRTNYNELWYNNQLCMIIDYQGLAKE